MKVFPEELHALHVPCIFSLGVLDTHQEQRRTIGAADVATIFLHVVSVVT